MLPKESISRERKVIEVKPKPLQCCWYGDKMVDIPPICDYFEDSTVWWSKVYQGNDYRSKNYDFMESLNIIDNDEMPEEMQEELIALDNYFYDAILYLH